METFLQTVARQRAAPIEIGHFLCSAVSNVICSLLMSVRFRHDDPRFIRFMDLFDEGFKLFTVTAAAGFIPLLRLLPGFNYAYNKIRAVSPLPANNSGKFLYSSIVLFEIELERDQQLLSGDRRLPQIDVRRQQHPRRHRLVHPRDPERQRGGSSRQSLRRQRCR